MCNSKSLACGGLSAFNRNNCAIAGAQKQPGNFLVEFMDVNGRPLALRNIMYRHWRRSDLVLSQQVLNQVLNFTVSGSQWFHVGCLGRRSLRSLHPPIHGGHFGNSGIDLRADGLARTRRWQKLGSRHSERSGDVHQLIHQDALATALDVCDCRPGKTDPIAERRLGQFAFPSSSDAAPQLFVEQSGHFPTTGHISDMKDLGAFRRNVNVANMMPACGTRGRRREYERPRARMYRKCSTLTTNRAWITNYSSSAPWPASKESCPWTR